MKIVVAILSHSSFLLFLLIPISSPVVAQQIDLSQSIQYALRNNESIKAAEQEIKAADSRFREAIQSWHPKFNLSADWNYYKKTPYQDITGIVEIVPGIKIPAGLLLSTGFEYYTSIFTLSATQSLLDSGIITANIAKARMNFELANTRYIKSKLSLVSRVTECFYRLLELNKKEQIVKNKIVYAKLLQDLSERKHMEGKTGFLEVLESQLKAAKYEQELISISHNKRQKQNEFAQLTNSTSIDASNIYNDVSFTPFYASNLDQILRDTNQNNPAIKEALIMIRINEYEIEAAKSDLKPSINLFGNLQYFKTGNTFGDSAKNFDRSWAAGFSANWAFFDSGKSLSKINAAVHDLEKSKFNSMNIVKNVTLMASEAYYNLEDAERKVDISKKQTAIETEKLNIGKKSYKRGRISQIEIEQRQIALEEATMDEVKSIIDYEILKTKLSEIVGREK